MENETLTKKHLTISDRNRIQGCLANKLSFKQIAVKLGKSPSTISREKRAHMFVKRKPRSYARYFNDCAYRKSCTIQYLCNDYHVYNRFFVRNTVASLTTKGKKAGNNLEILQESPSAGEVSTSVITMNKRGRYEFSYPFFRL